MLSHEGWYGNEAAVSNTNVEEASPAILQLMADPNYSSIVHTFMLLASSTSAIKTPLAVSRPARNNCAFELLLISSMLVVLSGVKLCRHGA